MIGSRMAVAGRAAMAAAGVACALAARAQQDADTRFYPPWSHGANNPVAERGLDFTVAEIDNLPDFHGDPGNAALSIFVGGNYFFAMAPLVAQFTREHPEFAGRIYYETIPPGLLVEQIRKNGTITVGNMTWTVHPDVYAGGLRRVKAVVEDGFSAGPVVPYATNTLAIMVPRGNPAGIRGLADLSRPGLRLVMPNPEFEGIGRQIKLALAKAGGETLVREVYDTKVKNGDTRLTRIHHRQSPLALMLGKADAGVTWQSEALFQEEAGNPIAHVAIPDAQNVTAIYAATVLKDAPHRAAGQMWVDFLHSPQALAIFERYGFKAYRPDAAP